MKEKKQELTVSQLASLGGKARKRKLSKERLSEIGRQAIAARWARRKQKESK